MMLDQSSPPADQLLERLNTAVAAANEAEKTVTTAKAELVSRSKLVGMLLLEAKKLHPAVKEFKAFLKRVDGLELSRAYDLMRLAGGRTTDEELKKDTRERVKKHRTKKLPKPEPLELSVTLPDVTEIEASAERRKAENADLNPNAEASARYLAEFTYACRTYLPKMAEADRQKARQLVEELTSDKAEAA
jgi:hypothetical protein